MATRLRTKAPKHQMSPINFEKLQQEKNKLQQKPKPQKPQQHTQKTG
jgi:hypothetical protein